MTDQTEHWAERTVEAPPRTGAFHRGVAQVGPRVEPRTVGFDAAHEPTGTGWPEAVEPQPRRPMAYHLAQLRRGGEWSGAGGLFAFVCWGIWAISARGNLTSPVLAFLLSLFVAIGLFALCRLIGRVVLERYLRRTRRTARPSHLITGAFLVAVGIAYLRQTEWVVAAWNWLSGLF
ncbi:hypothetical protein SAMN05444365_11454 [Micromonospora pattaloongensis]|uniref:Uncharacterized protein n=1 Tax=Micromonospora pattaloongensis TaxID=405436 RepID=A0A1H3SUE5_9ACTN|nr:hypothetical protein [Micromonospora pattaloongensis]SDZ41626.1 hypothetical protein SAMN05444365_11454 [Micromonospora pattaloongensis]